MVSAGRAGDISFGRRDADDHTANAMCEILYVISPIHGRATFSAVLYHPRSRLLSRKPERERVRALSELFWRHRAFKVLPPANVDPEVVGATCAGHRIQVADDWQCPSVDSVQAGYDPSARHPWPDDVTCLDVYALRNWQTTNTEAQKTRQFIRLLLCGPGRPPPELIARLERYGTSNLAHAAEFYP